MPQAVRRRLGDLKSVVALLVLFGAETGSAGQNHEPHRLFLSASGQQLVAQDDVERARTRSAKDRAVLRYRPVRVGIDGISDSETMLFDLFDGVTLTASQDRIEESNGVTVWVGHVPGERFSQVTIAVKDGAVSGTISARAGSYQVAFAGNGLHVLQEVDRNARLECGGTTQAVSSGSGRDEVAARDSASTAISDKPAAEAATGLTTIDVLVVYTDEARNAVGSDAAMHAIIGQGIADGNTAFANSGIPIHLAWSWFRVSYAETGDAETDLNRLQGGEGVFASARWLRDTQGFDLVQLVTERMQAKWCGLGNLGSNDQEAYSVVRRDCYNYPGHFSAVHEIGHNLGSEHDHDNARNTPIHSYSYGHRVPGFFHTVMSYGCDSNCPLCDRCTEIQYFSDPWVIDPVTGSGQPVGVPEGEGRPADNVRSMTEERGRVANYRYRPPIPGAFTLVSPSGSIGTKSPTFHWTRSSDATEYQFRVVDAVGTWVVDETVPANSLWCKASGCYGMEFLSEGDYSWSVTASNAVGVSGGDWLTFNAASRSCGVTGGTWCSQDFEVCPASDPVNLGQTYECKACCGQLYTLTVMRSGTGTGEVTSSDGTISCGATCEATYAGVRTVTLHANPNAGSQFSGWTGEDCAASGEDCTLTVGPSKTVTAEFTKDPVTLTVQKGGSRTGRVTSSVWGIDCGTTCTATYPWGTDVTLTATPNDADAVGGWSGACVGAACNLHMDASRTAIATFEPARSGPLSAVALPNPCRVLDTRTSGGPLQPGEQRIVPVTGATCGVPVEAKAVTFMIAATEPTSLGHLKVHLPGLNFGTSTVNFATGQTVASSGHFRLDNQGRFAVSSGGQGTVHFVVDVTGYFR